LYVFKKLSYLSYFLPIIHKCGPFCFCDVFDLFFFKFALWWVESKLGPLSTSATYWPIVPAPGDCEDGEFGGMNGRGNQTRD
jgi:hypothetical protein